MTKLAFPITAGTALQILMVVVGHFFPVLQSAGLFPIAGSLIGILTGWLTAPAGAASQAAGRGALAGGVAGAIGSLVSTALGDVPLVNVAIAGVSTIVAGGLGALLRRKLDQDAMRRQRSG
jgi:hypothetical protein